MYGKMEIDEQTRVENSLIVTFALLHSVSLFRSSVGAIPAVLLLSKTTGICGWLDLTFSVGNPALRLAGRVA